jgi:hypothetical protein
MAKVKTPTTSTTPFSCTHLTSELTGREECKVKYTGDVALCTKYRLHHMMKASGLSDYEVTSKRCVVKRVHGGIVVNGDVKQLGFCQPNILLYTQVSQGGDPQMRSKS